ncbi:GntR family transcriptional regulator [Octadecabacter sp.]|nr:GntR family transcriptional regulator [Octadecabacter sp.]
MKRNALSESQTKLSQPAGPTVTPLDYARPADEQIAIAVKAAILSMELPPGQLISEKEIGRMFGASRTPVRAAFAQLREEGLLTTWPSRGTFVTNLSLKEIKAAQFLREAIEATVVQQLCVEGLSGDYEKALSKNLLDQQTAIDGGDDASFRLLDDQFHALLVEATGYDRIVAALNREKAILDRLRSLTLTSDGTMERLRADHVAIVQAIKAGDSDAAVERLQTHVRLALETLSGLVERNRGYFDLDETTGEP